MSHDIDKSKILIALLVIIWGIIGAYLSQPLIHENPDAIGLIVTVFSILAGFLIAVITLIGDPKSLPAGGWQKAQLGSNLTYNRLARHKWLFNIYLATLALIFLSMLLKNKFKDYSCYIEYVYLFLAICAFTLSFKLPSSLMQIQKERIDNEIEERRKAEGIKDE